MTAQPAPADSTAAHDPAECVDCATGGDHGYLKDKKRYLDRLKRIEGQVRGVHRMVDEQNYCIDILTQISALNASLKSLFLALLDDHLHHCVAAPAQSDGEQLDAKLDEAMNAIRRLTK